MKHIEIIVDYENLIDLEKAYYDLSSYQNIINYLMVAHKDDRSFLKTEIFNEYMIDYEKTLYIYEGEQKLFTNYLVNELKNSISDMADINEFSWEVLDFTNQIIKINYEELACQED